MQYRPSSAKTGNVNVNVSVEKSWECWSLTEGFGLEMARSLAGPSTHTHTHKPKRTRQGRAGANANDRFPSLRGAARGGEGKATGGARDFRVNNTHVLEQRSTADSRI